VAARAPLISSPATLLLLAAFPRHVGMADQQEQQIPITDEKMINSSQAVAEPGRYRSGTRPRATTLVTKPITKMPGVPAASESPAPPGETSDKPHGPCPSLRGRSHHDSELHHERALEATWVSRRCIIGQFLGQDGGAEFASTDTERTAKFEDLHDLFDGGVLG
jgi:hypothetical protein